MSNIHRKAHLAWERAVEASNGTYGNYLNDVAARFDNLTPMEMRVAALVKALMPSWQIGDTLGITERAVENYRVKIRKKIGCEGSLASFLNVQSMEPVTGKPQMMGF